MKREYLYLVVLFLILVISLAYKSMFLESKINETLELQTKIDDLSAKIKRDSIVQNNINKIEENFTENLRDERSYVKVVAELIAKTEHILKKVGIKYEKNNILQDNEEVKEGKYSFFYITINFETDFKHLADLITTIEAENTEIEIIELNIGRKKINPRTLDENDKVKSISDSKEIMVTMKLQIVKYL